MSRRVLHAVASAGDTYGGVASAVAALGAVEVAAGHDAMLVTLDRPEQGTTLLGEMEKWYDVCRVPPGRIAGRFHGGRVLAETLRRQVPQHDLVVIHGVFDLASVVGSRTALRFGVPYLLWPHGSLDPYDLVKHARAKRLLSRIWREGLSGAAALMCTTRREAQQMVTFGADAHKVVLPVPLFDDHDSPARAQARTRWGMAADARVVLFLGRIDEKKGLPLLLEAFAAMASADDVLVIAGSGDVRLMNRLRRDAARCRGRVCFPGWVDAVGRRELLAAADVFVLPSDNENFGVAAAEAMRAGVATVLSEDVYQSDDLGPLGGTVVCSRTVDSVARALRTLLDDPDLRGRVARTGQRWAEEQLTVRSVAGRYRDLVDEVMSTCPLSVF